jgi:GGDEF domain-containing protein
MKDTIEALIALAKAETTRETIAALDSCRAVLSATDSSADLQPLVDSLTARARQVCALRRLAGCDALTGIANRRAFDEALEQWIALHNGSGTGLALVLLDLDGLKQLNDTQGHAAGDQAIVAVARTQYVRGIQPQSNAAGDAAEQQGRSARRAGGHSPGLRASPG